MKKVLIFLLVVGVLTLGTFSIFHEVCDEPIQENGEFSDFEDLKDFEDFEGSTTNGGGQDGGGPAPG